ncbi:2-polyprenyl-3-methyl-5-hydroxy-6-metoxy-1,4-benzoquinol methylase [Nitrosospira multiformis]|uniref:2-polyprenyl-3-methyl-5-hydroxy-6-metoxy-1,4-benzoquinol methylase n=1 Tax=Nitrosospira multiformis TaxID=1231 RepID=A0A1I0A7Q4_9PROT|nr:class I SAM-dependent methyltransferase [Nitrosospira multiformis]SES89269.1 2-polyprenyl-3-methyl-5-hydroxy-6-metoxy-1,4-benzoquinol methylase [Nitrosospira multiformis]
MSLENEQDSTAYDRTYVLDNRLTLQWYPQRVVAMAQTGSMLELGLGHGYSTEYFAKTFQRYQVVEGSQEMIDRFRKRFAIEGVDIAQGYFEDFETDERFDVIGMGFVLEHVDDPAAIIRRYAQFLSPGGSIYIAVPNAESLHRRLGHAAGLLPDIYALSSADLEFGHKRYFTLESLVTMVQGEGLRIRKVEGLLLKPITTQQMLDLNLSEAILQAMLKVGVDYPELCNSLLIQASRPG